MSHNRLTQNALLLLAGLLAAALLLASPLAGVAHYAPSGSSAAYLPLSLNNWPQSPTPTLTYGVVVISEVLYDPDQLEPNAEWVELYNFGGALVNLTNYKLGDAEFPGDNEGMYRFPPSAAIAPSQALIIANRADTFYAAYAFWPDYEIIPTTGGVPDMEKYTNWATHAFELTNAGDEAILLDSNDALADVVAFGNSTYAPFQPPAPDAPEGSSLERYPPWQDTDSAADWRIQPAPSPGDVDNTPPTATPRPTPTVTPTSLTPTPTFGPSPTPFNGQLLISEVLYDPAALEPDGEWIEIYNPAGGALSLAGFKLGDEETPSGPEGMLQFPAGAAIPAGQALVVARRADTFFALYGFYPDFEMTPTTTGVPDMLPYPAWAGGSVDLNNSGDDLLLLDGGDHLIDALSWGSSAWAFNPAAPDVAEGHSLERYPAAQDTDSAADWRDQPLPSPGTVETAPTVTPTPTATLTPTSGPTPTPQPTANWLLISEVLFDPAASEPAAEWIELYNPAVGPIDLSVYKVGDEEILGGNEGMYQFPAGALIVPGQVVVIANQADVFSTTYGFAPDYELADTLPAVPNMAKYLAWGSGSIQLNNTGDEVLLLDGSDTPVDAISYGSSTVFVNPAIPGVTEGHSIERRPANVDTGAAADWVDQPIPAPGAVNLTPPGRWWVTLAPTLIRRNRSLIPSVLLAWQGKGENRLKIGVCERRSRSQTPIFSNSSPHPFRGQGERV